MRRTSWMTCIVVVALVASASPSYGTIVFTAYADGDWAPAPCLPGLMRFSGFHQGTVYSMDPGDYGRQFVVEGGSGLCGISFPMSCSDSGSAGIDNSASCDTWHEMRDDRCQVATYKAVTTVAVTDGGGESASDETVCSGC